jgi:NADPH:quinone reductase
MNTNNTNNINIDVKKSSLQYSANSNAYAYDYKLQKFTDYNIDISLNNIPQGYALIKIHAFGINRADILQKMGNYPLKDGDSGILGLEAAGEVIGINDNNLSHFNFNIGHRVMFITSGGAYASHALIPLEHLISVPNNISYQQAAALPEAIFTVYHSLFNHKMPRPCNINPCKKHYVYVNAASSGIGMMAIQMCNALGYGIIASSSSSFKINSIKKLLRHVDNLNIFSSEEISLDAYCSINHIKINFALDMLGETESIINNSDPYASIVSIAFLKSATSSINISKLMRNNISITGTMLRPQSKEHKAYLTSEINKYIIPLISCADNAELGTIQPIINKVYGRNDIEQAHLDLKKNQHIGKLVIDLDLCNFS